MCCDSTLGYAEQEGFRCGTAHDFPVFDLRSRRQLRLREQPLLAMDVTFAQYQGCSPVQTLERLCGLRDEVQRFGGDFTLLWHNSSLNTYFWADFRPVLQAFIQGFIKRSGINSALQNHP